MREGGGERREGGGERREGGGERKEDGEKRKENGEGRGEGNGRREGGELSYRTARALPLGYNRTTTSPHNLLYVLHKCY